ncbi:MBL fold metallo-hydrolase [Dactylosporangium sp. NPDC051485]|uniref:MBL fold metallo-hydrolase n=1 Tax=Dactylosporangium sp. NPDC051485 TaxID=3154846 RepID=UPI0034404C40
MGLSDGGCTKLDELGPDTYAYLHSDSGWGHSNAGVVRAGDAVLLIDTQYTLPMTRQLITAIDDAGLPPVTTVVNTHANGDHAWGNQLFPSADIVASVATAQSMPHDFPPALMQRLLSSDAATTAAGRYTQLHFGAFDFDGVLVTTPTTTFTGTMCLDIGGREVVLREVGPAHSDGDVIIHVPDADVCFAGDILFAADHPVMWCGPLENWIAACDSILETGATHIVPGHGPVVGPDGVRYFRAYLQHVADGLALRFSQGMPYWEAAMDLPLGPYRHLALRERLVATAAATYHHLGAPKVPPAEVLERMAQAHFNAA